MTEVKEGAERAEQLWHYAKESASAEFIMRSHVANADAKRDHLISEWRKANAEAAALRALMREAGYEPPS
jgi:hypothetical protein